MNSRADSLLVDRHGDAPKEIVMNAKTIDPKHMATISTAVIILPVLLNNDQVAQMLGGISPRKI
jgi:hypothetical protein